MHMAPHMHLVSQNYNLFVNGVVLTFADFPWGELGEALVVDIGGGVGKYYLHLAMLVILLTSVCF